MEFTISATDLARKLGDVLGRIRFRGDSFVIERNGESVARLSPFTAAGATVTEGLRAWCETGEADPGFADDLERVNRADARPRDPWA